MIMFSKTFRHQPYSTVAAACQSRAAEPKFLFLCWGGVPARGASRMSGPHHRAVHGPRSGHRRRGSTPRRRGESRSRNSGSKSAEHGRDGPLRSAPARQCCAHPDDLRTTAAADRGTMPDCGLGPLPAEALQPAAAGLLPRRRTVPRGSCLRAVSSSAGFPSIVPRDYTDRLDFDQPVGGGE